MFQFDLYFSDGLKAPSRKFFGFKMILFFWRGPYTCYQRRTVNILGRVPPKNQHDNETSPFLIGNTSSNGWFSIVMFSFPGCIFFGWCFDKADFCSDFLTVPLQIPERRVSTCRIIPGLGSVVHNHGDHKSPQDRVVGPHGLFISFYRL